MKLAWLVVLVSLVGTAAADTYADLVGDDATVRDGAALAVLKDSHAHSRTVLRRAINVAAVGDAAKALPALVAIVRDESHDGTTRAMAALALGRLGSSKPTLWPPGRGRPRVHSPLPVFAVKELVHCLEEGSPSALRRACAEALGVAKVDDALPELVAISSDLLEDPALRIAAGRALTRITRVPTVPSDGFTRLLEVIGAQQP